MKEVKVFIWRSGGGGLAARARWRSEVAKEMSCRFASSLIGSLPGLGVRKARESTCTASRVAAEGSAALRCAAARLIWALIFSSSALPSWRPSGVMLPALCRPSSWRARFIEPRLEPALKPSAKPDMRPKIERRFPLAPVGVAPGVAEEAEAGEETDCVEEPR